jgi:acyl CoA:acetate/3-ketoacid CoA transferase
MNDKNKHPGGRPTSYRTEYCEKVIELGKEGYGKAEIAAGLDVERKTLDNWSNDFHFMLEQQMIVGQKVGSCRRYPPQAQIPEMA